MTFFAILHCVKYVFKYIFSTRWSLQEIKKEKGCPGCWMFSQCMGKEPKYSWDILQVKIKHVLLGKSSFKLKLNTGSWMVEIIALSTVFEFEFRLYFPVWRGKQKYICFSNIHHGNNALHFYYMKSECQANNTLWAQTRQWTSEMKIY